MPDPMEPTMQLSDEDVQRVAAEIRRQGQDELDNALSRAVRSWCARFDAKFLEEWRDVPVVEQP